ncbi:MAG TPA: MFS transporter [Actinomycetes bacterium]|nr:MFS transporter [Actinomycetes bacterium]
MVRKSNLEFRVLVAVVVTAVFMTNLDLWIVNVALVSIRSDLHVSLSAVSWVLNAYAVTLAALLVPAGRLGDRIGHRTLFQAGIATFTLASVACALAPNIDVLVAARVVQAAGAAAQLPSSLALLLGAVGAERRLAAARGWAAVGALAAVAGPVLGGLLVTVSWRWVFMVNLPVGALAWLAGAWALPRRERHSSEPMPDAVASLLLVVAVGCLTAALVEAPTWGWASVATAAMFLAAAVAGAWFVHRCRTQPNPMIELSLVRVRPFTLASTATFLFGAAFAIMLLSNALWCQTVWHYSALKTGLAMAPGPAMVPVVTFASARLVQRVGPGRVAAIGSVVFAGSQLWRVVTASGDVDYLRDLLPSMLLGGLGVGLALGTLIAAGVTALPPHRSGTGSAIVNSVRQVASTLGVAVLVTVLASDASVHGYRVAWVIAAAVSLLAALVSAALPYVRATAPRELSTAVA